MSRRKGPVPGCNFENTLLFLLLCFFFFLTKEKNPLHHYKSTRFFLLDFSSWCLTCLLGLVLFLDSWKHSLCPF